MLGRCVSALTSFLFVSGFAIEHWEKSDAFELGRGQRWCLIVNSFLCVFGRYNCDHFVKAFVRVEYYTLQVFCFIGCCFWVMSFRRNLCSLLGRKACEGICLMNFFWTLPTNKNKRDVLEELKGPFSFPIFVQLKIISSLLGPLIRWWWW